MQSKPGIIHGPTIALITLLTVFIIWLSIDRPNRKPSKIDIKEETEINYFFLKNKGKIIIKKRSDNEKRK